MSELEIYEEPLKKYCKEHNIDFDALAGMKLVWGIDSLEIRNKSNQPVIKISGYVTDDMVIEETDITHDYDLLYTVAT